MLLNLTKGSSKASKLMPGDQASAYLGDLGQSCSRGGDSEVHSSLHPHPTPGLGDSRSKACEARGATEALVVSEQVNF